MSRSGYHDYEGWDAEEVLAHGRWRAQVKSATRGKRGQDFLTAIVEALDVMPEKRLINSPEARADDDRRTIYDSLGDNSGNVCVLGALAKRQGVDPSAVDAEDYDNLGNIFNIAHQLARETMYMNDEYYDTATPEERWQKMRNWAQSQIKEVS